MLLDNPADRLRNIFEIGKQIPIEKSCRVAWAEIFSIDPANNELLYSKLGKVMQLPREILGLLKTNFPRQLVHANHWKGQVEAGFGNQNLAGQWATFINHIDHITVSQLAMTADLLGDRLSAKLLVDQDLEDIQKKISELLGDVDQAVLSPALKNYLARELSDMLQHIRDYKISGALPILKQAESMVGHVITDPEYKAFLKDDELGKRLLDGLNAAAAILTVALQLPQLSTSISILLK